MVRRFKGNTEKKYCDFCGCCVEITRPAKDKHGNRIKEFSLFGQDVFRFNFENLKEHRNISIYSDSGIERKLICIDCAKNNGLKFGEFSRVILDKRTKK